MPPRLPLLAAVAAAVAATAVVGPSAPVARAADYVAGDRFTALAPTRILDTRTGLGRPGGAPARVGPGGIVALQVTGVAGVPADADAVVLNVTGVAASASSYVSVYPASAAPPPTVSNLNLTAGTTRPNLVTVKIGDGGVVLLRNAAGSVDLVADLSGYYAPDAASTYTPLPPSRVLDTRIGEGAPQRPLGPGGSLDLQVTGAAGVPADASAVVVNVTATRTTASTYIQAYPTPATGTAYPTTSNLNLRAGATAANLVTVAVGAGGRVRLRNAAGSTDVIADIAGYFSADPDGSTFTPVPPVRLLDTRIGVGEPNGSAVAAGPGGLLDLQLTGAAGMPDNATGAVFNVTGVHPTTSTYLQAFPTPSTGFPVPTQSNVNLTAGTTVPNLVAAAIGAGGRVRLRNAAGTTGVLADLAGYYTSPVAGPHDPAPLTPRIAGVTVSAAPATSHPEQLTTLPIAVRTTPGSTVTATAHFPTSTTAATATADGTGAATASFALGYPTAGYPVPVTVTATDPVYRASATTTTSFTPTPLPGSVSGGPDGAAPAADGRVAAMTQVGNTIFVGGSFSHLGGYERHGLAAIDATTHQVLPGWQADVTGDVYALAPDPTGTGVVVGGAFSAVGGAPRANVADVAVSDGTVSSWNPGTNDTVFAIASSSSYTYLGGKFTQVAGGSYGRLVAVDPLGRVDAGFAPKPDSYVAALLLHDSELVVGGNFAAIGGATHWSLARVSASSGRASSWQAYPQGCLIKSMPGKSNCAVLGLAADPAWTHLYAAGAGYLNRVTSFSTGSTATSTYIRLDGNIQAIAMYGETLYAGGHFERNLTDGSTHKKVIALDPATLRTKPWSPVLDSPLGVWSLLTTRDGLWVGGDFATINGSTANPHLARFARVG